MRGPELGYAMALFAPVFERRPSELPAVNILVATAALCIRDLKQRVFAFGDMAAVALDCRMASLERIAGRGMLSQSKRRGLEPVLGVTRGTVTRSGACQELAMVVIGVAIAA